MADQELDSEVLNQTRREISRLLFEVEQLADQDIPPVEFYSGMLRRAHSALAARAAALWVKSPSGNLVLQSQVNLAAIGLDNDSYMRPGHDELLRQAVIQGKPALLAPSSGPGDYSDPNHLTNPTPYLLVLAPIFLDGAVIGLIEVFQEGARRGSAQQGYLTFITRMAGEASRYLKNVQYRRILSQQQRWNQVESYIRAVHGGLHPKQVAYLIANEGKRLVECERLSLALRVGKKTRIEAISGQDVVEKRSNLVVHMARLADAVIRHGENLVYTGTIEDFWPADTRRALEEYLAESGSKLIAVVPLEDSREFGQKGHAQAALLVEMIEDSAEPSEMGARVEVVARHGAAALYNALEHHRIFLLPLWRAIGNRAQLLGAHTGSKAAAILGTVIVLIAALVLIPWPLKLEGRGELVPETRRMVFAPVAGIVHGVKVDHNSPTDRGSLVVELANPQLERELIKLQGDLQAADQALLSLEGEKQKKGAFDPEIASKITEQTQIREGLKQQIALVQKQMEQLRIFSPIRGRVMDWKPKEKLLLRPVDQGDPLLEIADTTGQWLLEVQFPESAVTHIAKARARSADGKLPVTFVLSANPETTYHGTLVELSTTARAKENENIVEGKIALDPDEPLAKELIAKNDMVAGVEVRAKVNCGPHALGYVLFRQVIDFIREYVFF